MTRSYDTSVHHGFSDERDALEFKRDCLRPYESFTVKPECTAYMWVDHDWRLGDEDFINGIKGFEDVEPLTQPDVILLNGPAGSGKGWLGKWLESGEAGIDCVRFLLSAQLYHLMQVQGLPMTRELDYEQFKALPFGRERLIAAAKVFRAVDPNVFLRMVSNTRAYQEAKLAVIDNAGFDDEVDWYRNHSKRCALLTITQPFAESARSDTYIDISILGGQYPNDSRFALKNPDGIHLRAYDSEMAKYVIGVLLGDRLPFGCGYRLAELGEILRAAKRPEPAVTRGLFEPSNHDASCPCHEVAADGLTANEAGPASGA